MPGRLITTASADVALKGLAYLLEAMAKLRTERDVSLTIIGKPKAGKSMDLIESLGLATHVDFVSGVTDERIVELYAEAELAVVPSLYEGFSLPAIEAMVTGTALVATDGGALPEVTGRDGETVLPCRAGDADALAATIRRGLDDPELRARVGAAGRRRVVERWTWRRCAELTVEQYREVLAMPPNVAKLRRNGRRLMLTDPLRPPRRPRPAPRRPACSTPAPGSAATPSSWPAAAPASSPSTTPPTRSPAPRDTFAAMVEAGEIPAERVRRRAARRRHRAAVRRRQRSTPSITSEVLEHIPDDIGALAELRPRAAARRRARRDRADVAAREDQLDAVRRVPRAGRGRRPRAHLLGDRAEGQAARRRLRHRRQPPRPRPALAVLVAEVRRRRRRRRPPARRAATASSSSGTSSRQPRSTRVAERVLSPVLGKSLVLYGVSRTASTP